MNKVILALLLVFLCCASLAQQHNDGKYTLVGTGQSICYDHTGEIPCPQYGESFFGQDAHHKGRSPSYVDNGDGTITDVHAGLMWQKTPGEKVSYSTAISHAKSLNLARYDDWWLPNAKELHSIVDYTRSPAPSNSAAIDPIFNTTAVRDEGGEKNYPYYWTNTTHASAQSSGNCAVHIAFGEALGYMRTPGGAYELIDVYGAGAQRSDPKTGDPDDWPHGNGPQGDVVRIYNFIRCVRDNNNTNIISLGEPQSTSTPASSFPHPESPSIQFPEQPNPEPAGQVKEQIFGSMYTPAYLIMIFILVFLIVILVTVMLRRTQ